MTDLEALLLGTIQGVAEFLPISSSAHLILARYFLDIQESRTDFLFTLILHLGSMLAIFFVFSKRILNLIITKNKRFFFALLIGSSPLVGAVLIVNKIKALQNSPHYLGYFLLLTSSLICLSNVMGKRNKKEVRYKDSFIIGLSQLAATLPGLSRSGTTISTACLRDYTLEYSVFFSFMLAIPVIVGGIVVEGALIIRHPEISLSSIPLKQYLYGFTASFGFGIFSLKILMKAVAQNVFYLFAIYCLILSLFCLYYFQ